MAKIYKETKKGKINPRVFWMKNVFIKVFILNLAFSFLTKLLIVVTKKIFLIFNKNTLPQSISNFINYCYIALKINIWSGIIIASLTSLILVIWFLYFGKNKYNKGQLLIRFNQFIIEKQIEQALIDENFINKKSKSPNIFEVADVIVNLDSHRPFIMIEIVGDTTKKFISIESLINASLKNKFKHFIVNDISQSNDGRWWTFYLIDSCKSIRWNPNTLEDMIPENQYTLKLQDNTFWDISKNCHALITGSSGSGKTYTVYGLLIQMFLSGCAENVFIVDPKLTGLSRFSDFLPAGHVSSNTKEISMMISDAVHSMKERQTQINMLAKKNEVFDVDFTNFSEMKPQFIIIDELASLMSSFENEKDKKTFINNLTQLTMMSRSAGICLILLTQQPNVNSFGGSSIIREQLSLRILLSSSSLQTRTMIFGEGFEYSKTQFERSKGLFLLDGINSRPSLIETTNLSALGSDMYAVFKEAYEIGKR